MKKRLLFYILLSAFSFVPAQEYLPLHFSYKTIVPSKEKKVKLENVSFVAINERFTLFDFYKNKVDSIPMSFEAKIMSIIEKYNLSKVNRYAYRKSKKGNPLFQTKSRIKVGYDENYLKKYKKEIPYWLSIHRYGLSNDFIAVGIMEKHKNKFKLWDKKAAVKGLTPIETKEEALYFLHLMEYVVPNDNFNELCEKKGIYKIYTDTMTPTIVKEEKDYFVTNLFYYNVVDGSLFEIVYQLYKNGKYNILSKKRIYIILAEEWE
ncbi:hypothetical protein JMN11_11855 [Capnocytophaga genosp. AHN8471]|uniref:hypothetical protein n=1 Tax=Capnocytophaga genosp. AHN8471 TaxID=327574 RepID=UPI001932F9AC|nr:hypothetical protein [Capnocytophaga genosp. AHN8471]MBM0654355.1 hypothetical protein [Capnocytophaga genosp. AHN8471]